MSQSFTTCYIDTDGADVTQNFVEKGYLIDVYPNLINPAKAPSLWLWGTGTCGELGFAGVNRSSPIQTVSGGTNWRQIDAKGDTGAGIKDDGSLWLWGGNTGGKLGNNTAATRSSPIQTISGGTNWRQISLGRYHVAAIKTDNSLWVWGDNVCGQIGNNNTVAQSSPVQTISGGTNWKQVATSDNTLANGITAAIKTDGSLWLWGSSNSGQMGNNSTTPRSSPVQTVSGGTNWRQVCTGTVHIAAIKTDNTLWTWGLNNNGQLGVNATIDRSSPVQTVSGGTNWKTLSTGARNTAGIKTDNTLWIWGVNTNGNLGTNDTVNRSSPVQTVSGGTNWKQIGLGDLYISTSIKLDGTLWNWGSGAGGAMGTNAGTCSRSSPVQTVSGGTNWKFSTAGRNSMAAIREEGDW